MEESSLREMGENAWRVGHQIGFKSTTRFRVSLGGAEFENENLQVLCRGCHIAKTRKEFLRRRTNYGY